MEQVETKVDVLAAVDRAARELWVTGQPVNPIALDLISARAAIAELIEAAKHARVALYHATESARSQRTKTGNKHALSRIEAALRGMGAM